MTKENNFYLDLREKHLLAPVLRQTIKRLEHYLLDNEKARNKNLAKGKDNWRLWRNYHDKKNELDTMNILLTKIISTSCR